MVWCPTSCIPAVFLGIPQGCFTYAQIQVQLPLTAQASVAWCKLIAHDSGQSCWLSQLRWGVGGVTDIWWVEVRDAAGHPEMHRTTPSTIGNFLVQTVSGAEAEKPYFRMSFLPKSTALPPNRPWVTLSPSPPDCPVISDWSRQESKLNSPSPWPIYIWSFVEASSILLLATQTRWALW